MQQFNDLKNSWAEYTRSDTMRSCAQNPALLACLNEQKKQYLRILEIGCGEGRLARMLCDIYGAEIVAFDSSENSIEIARYDNEVTPQNIHYNTSTALNFRVGPSSFDAAVSVMVIPYANDVIELQQFFSCAKYHLKPDAQFISVVFRPEFSNFGVRINNRRFVRRDSNGMRIDFLNTLGDDIFSANVQNRFTKDEYQMAAYNAGFNNFNWQTVEPINEVKGSSWEEYKKDSPYEILVVW